MTLIVTYPNRLENGQPMVRIRFVQSSVGKRDLTLNQWYKFISSKQVRKLFLNKIK